MDAHEVDNKFELRDVPWVQYFEGGYALHAGGWNGISLYTGGFAVAVIVLAVPLLRIAQAQRTPARKR